MAVQPRVAYGSTIVFGTTGFDAQITNFGWSGLSRQALATSHMGTAQPGSTQVGNATYLPSKIVDPGSISITGYFDPSNAPILKQVPETITVTWSKPDGLGTAATWAGTGFMTDFNITGQLDTLHEFTATLKMSGPVTMTDEAT